MVAKRGLLQQNLLSWCANIARKQHQLLKASKARDQGLESPESGEYQFIMVHSAEVSTDGYPLSPIDAGLIYQRAQLVNLQAGTTFAPLSFRAKKRQRSQHRDMSRILCQDDAAPTQSAFLNRRRRGIKHC